MQYITSRESGRVLDTAETIAEAMEIVEEFEREDKEAGMYEPSSYDILNPRYILGFNY